MKRAKKHYKFTDKQHSTEGIVSTVFGVVSFIIFWIGIIVSFQNNGNAGIIVGILGCLAFLLSIVGFFLGMRSFKNKDVFYFFSYIGTIINTIVWFVMLCVIMVGI